MKNRLYGGLLVAVLMMGAESAEAKKPVQSPLANPRQETVAQKLERIELRCDELARDLSYTIWAHYLDYADRMDVMVDMTKFKGVRLRQLCDTVSSLRTLWVADSTAYARWQDVLRTDPEYQSVHDEYVSLKGISDRSKNDANTQRYNLMYDRLRRNNPDYVPARDAKNRSRRERDGAVARYLLNYYRMQGDAFPTDVISYTQMRILRQECSEIKWMEQELTLLQKLQRELREKQLREQYDVMMPMKSVGKEHDAPEQSPEPYVSVMR